MKPVTLFVGIGAVAGLTRRGDWGMCMRFWGENTRETERTARHRPFARAFHPKARSHAPITTPNVCGRENQGTNSHIEKLMVTASSSVRWVSDVAESRRRIGQCPIRGTSA